MIDETAIRAHLDALAKPTGSLGRLEDLAVRLALIQQRLDPATRPRRLLLFAADHGVVARGVSAWSQAVTGLMLGTILAGRATSSALAAAQACDVRLLDMGVASPPPPPHHGWFRKASLGPGTADLATGPAMSAAAFDTAWAIGAEEAQRAHAEGHQLLIAGEMGIGNSTSAACRTALLPGLAPEFAVGPCAGADDTMLAIKTAVVAAATARARALLPADTRTAIAGLCGFEIAAMAGFFAAGAAQRSTLLLDGFVATAAALVAERLAPGTSAALIAAHRSAEPGHGAALASLSLEPLLDWQMRLGEGTGALVALPLLDSAAALLRDVALLAELGV